MGTIYIPYRGSTGDPYYANVALLLHVNGSGAVTTGNLIDSGPNNLSPTSITGGSLNYQSPIKWGTNSISGVGSSVALYADSALWAFGSGDWTIECWAYYASFSGGFAQGFTQFFMGQSNGSLSVANSAWGLGYAQVSSIPKPYVSIIGASQTPYDMTGTTTLSSDTWHHIAATRVGNTVRLFLNGAVEATNTMSEAVQDVPGQLAICGYGNSGYPYNSGAIIDDIRITKGVGRYAGTYTVPSAAFPDF
jgi:hypothetical protein